MEQLASALQPVEGQERAGDEAIGLVDLDILIRVALRLASAGRSVAPMVVTSIRNLPPVLGNAEALNEAFGQIIGNAFDAMAPLARPALEITADSDATLPGDDGERLAVAIRVRDNGPGIPPENRERIFEPFSGTKPRGAGSGLAVARDIIVRHGGAIGARNPDSGGAEFLILLPQA